MNIFDLFNDRKHNVDSLVEGYDFDGYEEIEESVLVGAIEAFEEMEYLDEDMLEESMKENLSGFYKKVKENIDAGIAKAFKNPEKLRASIEKDKKIIESIEAELEKRNDEEGMKKIRAMAGRLFVYSLCPNLSVLFAKYEKTRHLSPTIFVKMLKKIHEMSVKSAEKKLSKIEGIGSTDLLEESVLISVIEAFEEMEYLDEDMLEESMKENLSNFYKKVKENIDAGIAKAFKNPEKLRASIEKDKKIIESIEAELEKRNDEEGMKKIRAMAGRLFVYGLCPNLSVLFAKYEKTRHLSPTIFVKMLKKIHEMSVKSAEKKLSKIESNNDTVTETLDKLDDILKESTMEFMEFQSASYLEDLVLENMMFEDFDEESISTAMEATMKERVGNLGEMIKRQWAKIRAWFDALLTSVADFFTSGEKFVQKYKNDIQPAMKSCNIKVKMYDYKPILSGLSATIKLIPTSGITAYNNSKASILKEVGAKDLKDVARVVKDAFAPGDRVEKIISSLDPKVAMEYAGNGKVAMDAIRKGRASVDADFKAILNVIKSNKNGKDTNEAGESIKSVFDFAVAVKSKIIKSQMDWVRQGSRDFTAVIKKAVGQYKPTSGLVPANESSMIEDLEFIDFE